MVKRFKGLKRLGAFVLSLVMAASMAMTVAPEMKVQAAGEYKLVTASENPEFVHSEWRFADALKDAVGQDDNKGVALHQGNDYAEYKFPDAYKFKGETYTIRMKFTPLQGKESLFPSSYSVYSAGPGGNLSINNNGSQVESFMTIRLCSLPKKTWDYEVWLTYHGDSTYDSDDMRLNNDIVPYSEVPLIVGQCYNANSGSGKEKIRLYSNDNKIIINVPEPSFDTEYDGWVNQNGYDQPIYYFLGMGYEDFSGLSGKGYVRGGYSTTNSGGAMEIRMGYKAYSIEYFPDNLSNFTKTPSTEFLPTPIGTQYSKPTDPTGDIAVISGRELSYLEIQDIYFGEGGSRRSVDEPIRLEDGTTMTKGSIIAKDDISKIAKILMDHNVEVKIYTVLADTKYTLTYHDPNQTVTNSDPVAKQTNLDAGSKPTNASSYKKGDIVTGLDGKQYRLDGWFTDNGIFNDEFVFGSTPIIADTDIYAKWTLYVPPTPTPEETETDTPPSTGEPIKVEFVTPIGNPPPTQIKHVGDKADDPGAPIDPATLKPGTIIDGHRFEGWYLDKGFTMPYNFDTKLPYSIILYAKWVRVSPKTGDTTIPPVYYVFGALALAGVGALAAKSRKLKK